MERKIQNRKDVLVRLTCISIFVKFIFSFVLSFFNFDNVKFVVVDAPRTTKLDTAAIPLTKSDCVDIKRDHQIMQNFAKAIWKVLKEYKEKLKVLQCFSHYRFEFYLILFAML